MIKTIVKEYWQALWMHRPEGIGWLLFPSLWALWIANHGFPSFLNSLLFIVLAFLAYAGIYIIDDLTNQRWHKDILPVKQTPLRSQKVTKQEAWILFFIVSLCVLLMSVLINGLLVVLVCVGFVLALLYYFIRYSKFKIKIFLVLFSLWSIFSVFALRQSDISALAYLLAGIVFLWLILYDRMNRLVNTQDKIKMHSKAEAIHKVDNERLKIAILQIILGGLFLLLGIFGGLNIIYFISLLFVVGIFIYQQRLIKQHDQDGCYLACLHNKHMGIIIFLGILFSYLL